MINYFVVQFSRFWLSSLLLLSNSFIISHLFEFVKPFFKISFDFFRLSFFSVFWDATFTLYHALSLLSSPFSKFLLTFFLTFALELFDILFVCFLFCALQFFFLRLLSGIPLGSLSFRLLFCAALVSQLYYYTLFDYFCQDLFRTFLQFVRFAYLLFLFCFYRCWVCTMGLYWFSMLGVFFLWYVGYCLC